MELREDRSAAIKSPLPLAGEAGRGSASALVEAAGEARLRPVTPKDGLPPRPSLAGEGGGFEEGEPYVETGHDICAHSMQIMTSHDTP